jgi:hypothetical protein
MLSSSPFYSRLREEGRIPTLPSSPPLSILLIFIYAAVWLEVSLALLTSLEVLSIIMYDLSRPNPLPWCLNFFTELLALSSMFVGFSPTSMAIFQVFRSSFFKARSTFLRGSLATTRRPLLQHHRHPSFPTPPAALHSASQEPVRVVHAPSGHSLPPGHGSHASALDVVLSSAPLVTGVADFWDFLLFIYFCFILLLGFKYPFTRDSCIWFVLVPIFSAVLDLDYFSASIASAIFGSSLLFLSLVQMGLPYSILL